MKTDTPAITINEAIFIARSPEIVWDFTQDYSKRTLWDKAVVQATILQSDPRIVSIKGAGIRTELIYKQDNRPHKTSLAMTNTISPIIAGGGGSWQYIPLNNGTTWTQTNTLILKGTILARMLRPLVVAAMRRTTRKSMQLAKKMIEAL
jgi:polyketide cyclase/dehydrase/lipid transport protein